MQRVTTNIEWYQILRVNHSARLTYIYLYLDFLFFFSTAVTIFSPTSCPVSGYHFRHTTQIKRWIGLHNNRQVRLRRCDLLTRHSKQYGALPPRFFHFFHFFPIYLFICFISVHQYFRKGETIYIYKWATNTWIQEGGILFYDCDVNLPYKVEKAGTGQFEQKYPHKKRQENQSYNKTLIRWFSA